MLRIAVVDAGAHWQDYAAALRRAEGVSIGLVVDRDEDLARQLLVSVGGDGFSRSIDELEAHRLDAFDAAVVHSPLEARVDTICRLAESGKHLLVDAPLATTVEELDRAVQACEAAKVRLLLRQPLRNSPAVQNLRAAVDTGRLGAPGLVRLHHWDAPSLDHRDGPARRPRIWELCYREVDLACGLFDTEPDSVFALSLGEDATGIECGVQLHLSFAGGGMALVDCLRTSRCNADPYFMLTLIGSTGAAYIDDHRNTNLLLQDGRTALQLDSNTDMTLQLQQFAHFLTAEETSSAVEDSRRATSVIQAALASIDVGQAVPIG